MLWYNGKMYGDEEKNKLEKLQRKLYSRNAPDLTTGARTDLVKKEANYGPQGEEVKEDWENLGKNRFDDLAAKVSMMAQKKNKYIQKIFLFSVLFFVIAAGVAAFVFLGGMNAVSSKNVDIKVVGPLSVGSGQEVAFDINVINNNNVDLKSASLLVEYPAGTRSAVDLSKELSQERFELETIRPGNSYAQKIEAVFFGEKNDSKNLKISLEYMVENSSALFYKEKIAEVSISSAPVIITPTYPKEANSNQEVSFNIELVSNSKDQLNDFLVSVDYPFGFVFKEASPGPSFGNNIWQFASLKQGEKKTVSIRGNIIGQDNEERVFKINAGLPHPDDERMIAVPFSQLEESILVKKPFINLDVFIEGRSGDFVAQEGGQVTTEFVLRNNLPSRLFNVSVEAAFVGGAFNGLSVYPGNGGFFQSFNNTILWDERSEPGLADMEPGQQKSFSFRLSPLPYKNIVAGAKPEIEMMITAKGERILETGSVEQVTATEIRKISLGTDISLNMRVVRSLGSIENSGPVPPRADTPTTYTVIWGISNSLNQVSNVLVRAKLPSYVKWTEIKIPQSESFVYDATAKELVWNAGSILPNTGSGSAKKELQFQLEFLPSTSQIGQVVSLLSEVSLSGIDKSTGQKVEKRLPGVTTDFSGDPSFRPGDDKVVQ